MRYMKFFICLLGAAAVLNANPKNHTVVSGDANISHDGNLTEIHVSDRAILNWEEFSIQAGETTRFIQSSQTAAVLNRVTGSQMSEILGLLQAGGQVYLINPNGVVIGKEGRIDTAGFVSSVYEIQNVDFLNGEPIQFHGDELGEIINLGTITTTTGPVALIAHRVENSGTISSAEGIVSLNSGHEILLDPTGQGLLFIRPDLKGDGVENNGTIEAYKTQLQADGTPTSLAISLGGTIDASSVRNIGGEVYLIAKEGSIDVTGNILSGNDGQILLHAENRTLEFSGGINAPTGDVRLLGKSVYLLDDAQINASEGTVLIGGDYRGLNPDVPKADYVYCSPNATVNVGAAENGNGGKAIFWGEKGIAFFGNASAQGGKEGGDGGFVEVSSPGSYIFKGLVNTLAPHGKAGKLLLDPCDITIDTNATMGGAFSIPPPPFVFTGVGATANILNTDLQTLLGMGNVQIDATAGAGGSGNITVDASLMWSANTLDLVCSNDLTYTSNAILTISGTANHTMTVPNVLTMNSGSAINFSSAASPFALTSALDVIMNGNLICTSDSDINITATGGNFIATGSTISTSGNGNITLTAAGRVIPFPMTGRNLALINSSVSTTGNGNISFIPTVDLTPIFFNGGTASSTGSGSILFNPLPFSVNSSITLGGTVQATTPVTFYPASFPIFVGPVTTLNGPQFNFQGQARVGRGVGIINTTANTITFEFGVGGETLTVNATVGDIILQGNSSIVGLTMTAAATIQVDSNVSLQVTGGDLTLQGNNIQIGNNVLIEGAASVILLAGQDLTVTGTTGIIQTTSGNDLTLVVDNNNPNYPDIGTGKFTFPSGYTLCTNSCSGTGGKVLLFAASPGSSTFPSIINTAANDGSNVFTGYWYITKPPPDPPLFQIMYKGLAVPIPPGVVETIQIAVTEPVSNPPQITQITEGNLQPPATPNPKTPCRTPPVAIQAL